MALFVDEIGMLIVNELAMFPHWVARGLNYGGRGEEKGEWPH